MVFDDSDGDDVRQWGALDDYDDPVYIPLLKWLRRFWMGTDDRRVTENEELLFLVSEVARVPGPVWTCRLVVWDCRCSVTNTVMFRLKDAGEEA